MAKQTELFTLIKSLSKSEKAYFTKYIVRKGELKNRKYFQLFSAIDQQRIYDEKAIKYKFRNEQFVKRFPVAKDYLFQTILKSLKHQSAQDDTNSILYNYLIEAEILFTKSFYVEAERKLRKALDLAEQKEKFPFIIEASDRLFRLLQVKYSYQESNTSVIINKQFETIEKINQLAEIKNLVNQFKRIRDNANSGAKNEFENLKLNPYLKEEIQLNSFRAKVLAYNLEQLINLHDRSDKAKQYAVNKKLIDLFHENPIMAKEEQLSYVAILNNFISDLISDSKIDDYQKYIQVLESLEAEKPEYELRIFEKIVSLKLQHYIIHKQFEDGLNYCHQIKTKLESYSANFIPNFFIAINDSLSILYFHAKDYSNSIRCINKILFSKNNIMQDIKCFSQILYLIVQFEKHDFDHLEYHLKSAEKFVKKNALANSYAHGAIRFFKNAIYSPDHPSIRSGLKSFIADMADSRKYAPSIFQFFDLEEWGKNKLHNDYR